MRREQNALWQRLYLDLIALAVAGLVYWLTARTGFSAVVNPDSNPTLSLSVYMFLAPALLWLGATLLLVRLRGSALTWLVRRVAGRRARTRAGFLLASAGRRGAAINRGLVIVGLLLAFGVELGLFTATYDQQARADAQLTLGADVVATAPPGTVAKHDLLSRVAGVPGVAGVTGVDHSYAFLSRLRRTRDGVVVSKETITDYSLKLNDLLRLRVLDRSRGSFRVVPFHDIRAQTAQTSSSITTVDLRGITRIEEVFALVLAAAAMALFVSVGLAERRHELATMAAVGASLRSAAAFLGGLAAAAVVGGLATAALAALAIRRLPLGAVLREE